jgi:hypothetical protein
MQQASVRTTESPGSFGQALQHARDSCRLEFCLFQYQNKRKREREIFNLVTNKRQVKLFSKQARALRTEYICDFLHWCSVEVEFESAYAAAWTCESTHVLNNTENRQFRFSAEADLLAHIDQRNLLCKVNCGTQRAKRIEMIETCGVETINAPSGLNARRCSISAMCSSDVPGGVSTIK